MFKRGIIMLLILGFVITPVFYANATDLGGSWAQATAYLSKEFGLDVVARVIARTLLNKMVSGLITKIQTGGEGGKPTFVQNWTNFLTDSQYRGEDVFRAILASTPLCGYLGKNIKDVFGVKSNQIKPPLGQNLRVDNFDPFSLRSGCTMPSNFNVTNYQKDFSGNGGWNTFSRMLEPQNNYYGLLFSSLDEAARQRNINKQAGQSEAQAGSGYTSIRDGCQDQLAGTGIAGPSQPSQARCTFMGKVFTPADLLGKTAASTIDKDLGWLVSSDELSEVVINVISASINRLANLATSKVTNDYAGSPKVTDPVQDGYNACLNNCNSLGADSPDYQSCTLQCSRDTGAPIPNPIPTEIPPIVPPEKVWACTQLGQDEQDFMLPLLNGTPPVSPQDVTTQANDKFRAQISAIGETEALYYPNNNTIGLPEFYLAGPTTGRPVSPQTGLPWDVVVRCSP